MDLDSLPLQTAVVQFIGGTGDQLNVSVLYTTSVSTVPIDDTWKDDKNKEKSACYWLLYEWQQESHVKEKSVP